MSSHIRGQHAITLRIENNYFGINTNNTRLVDDACDDTDEEKMNAAREQLIQNVIDKYELGRLIVDKSPYREPNYFLEPNELITNDGYLRVRIR